MPWIFFIIKGSLDVVRSPLQEGMQTLDIAHKLAYYAATIGQNKLWVDNHPTFNPLTAIWWILLGFVELSCVWSIGKKNLACFIAHCESFVQDIKIIVLEIRVLCCFWEKKLDCHHILYFSLKIVKSLQLRGRI